MKYFTKEWYELCQKTGAHLCLEETREAEVFSEEYFQKIYDQKLAEWLTLQEEVASMPFEDFYPAEMNTEFFGESMTEEEITGLKKAYRLQREAAKENYSLREPFNREKETQQFQLAFTYRVQDAEKILPGKILKRIADIRVFALDKASHHIIEAVTGFCEENRNSVEAASKKYRNYYENAFNASDKDIVDKIHFHDCIVNNIKEKEQSLTLVFDNTGGFTNIKEMELDNYSIIHQPASLQGSWCLYEEVYITDGKYELHFLLQDENLELIEFIVLAEHISFK